MEKTIYNYLELSPEEQAEVRDAVNAKANSNAELTPDEIGFLDSLINSASWGGMTIGTVQNTESQPPPAPRTAREQTQAESSALLEELVNSFNDDLREAVGMDDDGEEPDDDDAERVDDEVPVQRAEGLKSRSEKDVEVRGRSVFDDM